MQRFHFCFAMLAAVFVGLLTATNASAQATRTWVSGVGDDANPCSRTAPCKTFAGAISKTAAGGEINTLDPGSFGTVTINKAITIDGGGIEGFINAGGASSGVIINAGATDRVVLRNLSINGLSQATAGATGINIVAALIVELENVRIANFSQACIMAQVAASVAIIVSKSELSSCAGGGILSSGGTGVNRISVVQSRLARLYTAIQAGANTSLAVSSSHITHNGGAGIQSTAATAQVTIDQTTITIGGVGVQASNSSIVRITSSSITNNFGTGLLADTGGQILTLNNNLVGGNNPDGSRTGTILPQ